MKPSLIIIIALLLVPIQTMSGTVYCTNCSDKFMQAIEKATSLEQLKTLVKEYDEAIQQTAAQLQMVQQNIEQYTNMVQKYSCPLPKEMIRKIAAEMSKFGKITGALSTMRNDVVGLGNVFDELYSAQSELKDLARMPRNMLQGGMTTYHTSWGQLGAVVGMFPQKRRSSFQGSSSKDLEESGELEAYVNELLSTPGWPAKALMAGNQLAALQIQEARQLRELLATKIQSDLASQDKAEKESQMGQELHRYMLEGFGKIGTTSRPDPF